MKTLRTSWFGGLLAWGLVMAPAARAEGNGPTLLVYPAQFSVLQVMFDVRDQVGDVVLLAYQGNAKSDRPLLHAWSAGEWVYISPDSFRQGDFLRVPPARVVLVGADGQLPPMLAEAANAWCPVVLRWAELDTPALVNACGKLFDFTKSQWAWFAARYRMNLRDDNADRRAQSWYNQPFDPQWDVPTASARTREPAATPAPAAPAPAAAPVAPRPVKVVEPPPAPVADLPAEIDPPAGVAPNAMWETTEP